MIERIWERDYRDKDALVDVIRDPGTKGDVDSIHLTLSTARILQDYPIGSIFSIFITSWKIS